MSQFLGSDGPEEPLQFEALGHAGSDNYIGLETFPNPGCISVKLTSDEVMAKCPITGQPDFYVVSIELEGTDRLIESKSLKIWFQNLMLNSLLPEGGIFCEALAVHIRDTVMEAINEEDIDNVSVTITQKPRGGIEITARA